MPRSVVIFADSQVGFFCVKWLVKKHRADLSCIVTTSENDIYHFAVQNDINAHVFDSKISCL